MLVGMLGIIALENDRVVPVRGIPGIGGNPSLRRAFEQRAKRDISLIAEEQRVRLPFGQKFFREGDGVLAALQPSQQPPAVCGIGKVEAAAPQVPHHRRQRIATRANAVALDGQGVFHGLYASYVSLTD